MFGYELSSTLLIIGWSIAAVGVGMVCGIFIGRWFTLLNEPRKLAKNRKKTLTALVSLMASTDQLNDDMDSHNSKLQSVQNDVKGIASDGDVKAIQDQFLDNISRVISSNRRLENDLVQTRFKLEHQAQELDRTRKEARTDDLCGVGSRKAYDEAIQFMISRHETKKKSFGLMLIDVDHFKRINDTFGHAAGDQVLMSLAKALQECVRNEDFVGRLGGDEFAVILKDVTEDCAEAVGTRIHSKMELCDFSVGNEVESTVVTMSMGLAVVMPSDNQLSIYERADHALYRSKEQGRNRLCTLVYDDAIEFEANKTATRIPTAPMPVLDVDYAPSEV